MRWPLGAVASLLVAIGLCGCGSRPDHHAERERPEPIQLASVAGNAGIHFRLGHHGRSPLTILDTAGGGCAFLDYDQDGWPDILLVGPFKVALYHNERNGTFRDVTPRSGLLSNRHWMGCAVGDYDGDGRPDVVLTGYRCFGLFHNEGDGRFRDVTRESGIAGLEWSMSAAFGDVNGDGKLDLYITQYLHFGADVEQLCPLGELRTACGPEVYQPLSGRLYLNQGNGHFRAHDTGHWKDTGKTWGALISGLVEPSHPSIYLANDMLPGDLWVRRGAAFRNSGIDSGTAYDAQGHLQGGMAVDSGDYDNDGKLDLLVTTFFAQPTSLYHNDGSGLFTAVSSQTGLGAPTMPYVKFGTAFADLDNDGWLDIITANGHVRDNIHDFDSGQTYAQPMQVFRNQGGTFKECPRAALPPEAQSLVGRGLAVADYNRDGLPDVLVVNLEGEAVLLQNRSRGGHWLDVRLQQTGANRFGIGARVELRCGGLTQLREVKTCGSVLSAQDPVAHFGLGDRQSPATLKIMWADGTLRELVVDRLDQTVTVRQR